MKNRRIFTLAIAAFAMVGMVACNSTSKEKVSSEIEEEVIEEVVEITEEISDSTTVVADTTVTE